MVTCTTVEANSRVDARQLRQEAEAMIREQPSLLNKPFLAALLGALLVLPFQAPIFAAKIQYTYDAAGRLVAEDYGGGKATSYNYDPNGNLRTNITAVAASADVRIASISGFGTAPAGSPNTYTIVVNNNGPEVATAVVLTDPLPFGIIPTGANATQGACDIEGRLVTCNLGALLPGGGATISISGISGLAGLFTNVATVTSVVGDPNLTNNTATNVSTATAPADNDNDGMPNWWETLHGLSAFSSFGDNGANGDPDGDGVRNFDEWLADTRPNDATSFFAIDDIAVASGVTTLQFQSSPIRRYRAEFTPALESQPFTNIAAFNGNGLMMSVTHTNSAGGFYRLQAEVP
jgi:uncharacterized repeat protein (TIGR01451 family)